MSTPVVTETQEQIEAMNPQQISQLKVKYEVPQNRPFRCVLAHLIWAILVACHMRPFRFTHLISAICGPLNHF